MILNILLLIVGFVLLIKGADIFVDGASSGAQNFKISKMLIGLTIVAFGTSAPEFAVSMSALSSGSTDMVLGNVIGSCILNILLIIGIAAVIHPIDIKDNTIKKELPLTLLISSLLAVLMLDMKLNNDSINQVTRSDGIVILLFFTIFLYYLISLVKKKKNEKEGKPKYNILVSFILVGLGLAGIIFGSNMVVDNAEKIAKVIGVSERIIALTVIAFGTSLPELVTTIVASRKGEQDILLGNIIGSNIFNVCVVLGIPVVIFGSITPGSFSAVDLFTFVGSSLLLLTLATTKKQINRLEGLLMLLIFAVYYTLVFVL